jgi:hypothetical protein
MVARARTRVVGAVAIGAVLHIAVAPLGPPALLGLSPPAMGADSVLDIPGRDVALSQVYSV